MRDTLKQQTRDKIFESASGRNTSGVKCYLARSEDVILG